MGKEFDLEAEIRDLAARRDIMDAAHRYMRGLDRLDRDLLLSAFHEDAHVDVGMHAGARETFADFALGFLEQMAGTHHMLGQIRIEMHDAGNASGECYFQAWHDVKNEAGEDRDLFISGRYIDEYACRNGEWRIVRRRLISDWTTDHPASRGFFDQGNPHRLGRRGEDFSDTRDWPA
ncbi:hypothetical protein GCM10011371_00710 [Novosphingobium marinum]|uniref:SnoaL-like domain-containing protein n=1 Tax=Novosphingobium marinum TaxID=1514948 RepID=A0A7Y9XV73_9SPHN|nr:nuclear transport factor 2 family protein [Novosphingobium marinum]NYH93763.1 hypothetical protein [Novosphingobium marinum]GGC17140.1 hypothetical protein GCM10011371_00710 [Novosphingobium marinum]